MIKWIKKKPNKNKRLNMVKQNYDGPEKIAYINIVDYKLEKGDKDIVIPARIGFAYLDPQKTYIFSFKISKDGIDKGLTVPPPFSRAQMKKIGQDYVAIVEIQNLIKSPEVGLFDVEADLIEVTNIDETNDKITGHIKAEKKSIYILDGEV